MLTKKIKRKTCYYNKRTGLKSENKPRDYNSGEWMCFDSVSEREAFVKFSKVISLNSDLLILTQQPLYFGEIRWKIDFKLIARSERGKDTLSQVCKKVNGALYNPRDSKIEYLYLEYKGIQDSNFKKKQKLLSEFPSLDYKLVLCSSDAQAFVLEKTSEIYCKIIPSVSYIENIIRKGAKND